jgi:hypothetical protein
MMGPSWTTFLDSELNGWHERERRLHLAVSWSEVLVGYKSREQSRRDAWGSYSKPWEAVDIFII